ncbi:hypothetical protein GCM10022231_32990 [Gordonia caeni]|uniref:GIY-YIG domain-containing protein n=2 Tax=Gordonia caeni TaxID=1007097 RepID=A0ABP7PPU3_9ACTN
MSKTTAAKTKASPAVDNAVAPSAAAADTDFMNGYVYILRCGDDSYYVGSTRDIEHRMDQHLAGKGASYTSRRMPVELVFSKECESVSEAWAIERRLHGWSRAKKEALIAGRFDLLPELSRRRGRRGRA